MNSSLYRAVLGVLLLSTTAEAQVNFVQKFPEDTKYVTNHDTQTTQKLTLLGMDNDLKSSTLYLSTTTIGSRDAEGRLLIRSKIDSLQSELSLPGGNSLQFDSANPDQKAQSPQLEPVLDILRSTAGQTVNIELDSKNQLLSVKLPAGQFEKLPEAARELFDEDNLRKQVEQATQSLPDEPVKPGDKWERSREIKMGFGQKLSFRTKYEYSGATEKDGKTLEKITGQMFDVNFTIDGNPALQVTKSELKVVKSEITILFDPELGAIISNFSSTQIAGPITLVINNMELPGNVDLLIEEKIARQR